jgi:opacity protein-like surface antigen
MKAKHILLGCALTALSANAIAADKTGRGYVGVGYSMFNVSPEFISDFELSSLGVRGGYYFNNYFSLEGRLGLGVSDDTQTISGFGDITLELDYVLGVYAVGHIPLSERFQLYGLAGITKAESTFKSPGFPDETESETDLSLGVGAEFDMTPNWSLAVEYTSWFRDAEIDNSGGWKYDADGFGIAVNYIFN